MKVVYQVDIEMDVFVSWMGKYRRVEVSFASGDRLQERVFRTLQFLSYYFR
ncbi:hypothetical protein S7335_2823 [Synechococcus sp. PCC 7335]|uniref:hypothetical protein n=1 Tax=Synechococcus sp. (strain ATCC 29403 / PCC 7335) TaxID=91464 RepID=UPI00017ED8DE|nr:hypothetical protein [Synechococcus sp. PCC 7335]EDX85124.1 hypothetical protein S7335_2823 [Synechococcus sp. PCC 7335]